VERRLKERGERRTIFFKERAYKGGVPTVHRGLGGKREKKPAPGGKEKKTAPRSMFLKRRKNKTPSNSAEGRQELVWGGKYGVKDQNFAA